MAATQKPKIEEAARAAMGSAAPPSENPTTMAGSNSDTVKKMLLKYEAHISQALPHHIDASRFIQIAATAAARNPDLLACTPASFIGAVMQAACSGLSVDPNRAECNLVPYNVNVGDRDRPVWQKQVQFQIGYLGFQKLAYQSGQVKWIYAECVYPGDRFHVQLGTDPRIDHTPDLANEGVRTMTHCYAVAKLTNGEFVFVVLNRSQVEHLRLKNRSQKGDRTAGAWDTDYDSMAKAKVVKLLARKQLPLSDEVRDVIQTDEGFITTLSNTRRGVRAETTGYLQDDGTVAALTEGDAEAEMPPAPLFPDKVEVSSAEPVPATQQATVAEPTPREKELAAVRDGVALCMDVDSLTAYYKQNPEWKKDREITGLFRAREAQLNPPKP